MAMPDLGAPEQGRDFRRSPPKKNFFDPGTFARLARLDRTVEFLHKTGEAFPEMSHVPESPHKWR